MHTFFAPHSSQAHAVVHLWWWMLGVGGVIWTVVIAVAIAAAFRGRRRGAAGVADASPGADTSEHGGVARWVIAATIVTVVILMAFTVFDFSVGRALAMHPSRALVIDVTGHQWWWEARYENPNPAGMFVTANEIHIPTGEMVEIELRSADVIHSMWIPSLNGKEDLIPGYTSTLWFHADSAGTYGGQCAEFCGLQHALMRLTVVAEPREAFEAWAARQQRSAPPPADATARRGHDLFLGGPCATCHSISGTPAHGTVGPDLTHFASRSTIAAGALPNSLANTQAFIVDAPRFKPGTLMPAMTTYTGAELRAIAAYLWTLR